MTALKIPVTAEDHIQGSENAPITLVKYGDYQCPFCGQAYYIVKRIQEYFGDQLRFVFRNFPLSEMHPYAEPAAETAEFAADNGQFWEMHDLLYENQERLSTPLLFELAGALKLSSSDLEIVLESARYKDKIKNDFMGGVRSGVNGTPTFFINGQRYNGSFEFEELISAIKANAS